MRPFIAGLISVAVVGLACASAEAGGPFHRGGRQVIRQKVVVQQVVAPAYVQQAVVAVQPVYVAPVVQSYAVQSVVVPQAVYSAPVVQSFSSGCGVSQSIRLRSSVGGCGAFFGH